MIACSQPLFIIHFLMVARSQVVIRSEDRTTGTPGNFEIELPNSISHPSEVRVLNFGGWNVNFFGGVGEPTVEDLNSGGVEGVVYDDGTDVRSEPSLQFSEVAVGSGFDASFSNSVSVAEDLTVNGSITGTLDPINISPGTENQILSTNGAGETVWIDDVAAPSVDSLVSSGTAGVVYDDGVSVRSESSLLFSPSSAGPGQDATFAENVLVNGSITGDINVLNLVPGTQDQLLSVNGSGSAAWIDRPRNQIQAFGRRLGATKTGGELDLTWSAAPDGSRNGFDYTLDNVTVGQDQFTVSDNCVVNITVSGSLTWSNLDTALVSTATISLTMFNATTNSFFTRVVSNVSVGFNSGPNGGRTDYRTGIMLCGSVRMPAGSYFMQLVSNSPNVVLESLSAEPSISCQFMFTP
jgi:hypothetical protein